MLAIVLIVILKLTSQASAKEDHNWKVKFSLETQKCCKFDEVFNVDSKKCEFVEKKSDENTLYLGFYNVTLDDFFASDSGITFPMCNINQTLVILSNTPSGSSDEFLIEETESGLVDVESAAIIEGDLFCLDQGFQSDGKFAATVAIFCNTRPDLECQNRSCVRLCCHDGHYFDATSAKCVALASSADEFDIPVHFVINEDEKQFFGVPSCDPRQTHILENISFNVEPSGNLMIQNFSFDYNHYCLGRSLESSEMFSLAIVCPNFEQADLIEILIAGQKILRVLFLVSVGFLIAAFLNIFLENRHKLFGVMTLCMITMLTLFFTILAIPNFLESDFVHTYPLLCKIEALAIQFCYLSAMCWLNSMSFNIWITFRHLRNRHHTASLNGWRHRTFKWYALWSWGVPSLVGIITLTMDSLPKELTSGHYLPQLATSRCFLGDDGMIFYFHIINLPLLSANLVMYILSSWNICCGVYGGSSIIKSQSQKRIKFASKMFIIMGISWIAEIISFILGQIFEKSSNVVRISFFFDCINALQGLIIFCSLCLTPETMKKMKKKFQGSSQKFQSELVAGRPPNPTSQNVNNTNNDLCTPSSNKNSKKELSNSCTSITEMYHFVELNKPEAVDDSGRWNWVARWLYRKSGSYQVTQ